MSRMVDDVWPMGHKEQKARILYILDRLKQIERMPLHRVLELLAELEKKEEAGNGNS